MGAGGRSSRVCDERVDGKSWFGIAEWMAGARRSGGESQLSRREQFSYLPGLMSHLRVYGIVTNGPLPVAKP